MTRADWIVSAFSREQCAALALELRFLHGDAARRERFLEAAGEAVDTYIKLAAPAASDARDRADRLVKLARAARAYAHALRHVDDDTRDLIEIEQHFLTKTADFPPFPFEDGSRAELAARACERLLAKKPRQKGPVLDRGITSLVRILALAFARLFGERPSAEEAGTFARALNTILEAAAVRDPRTGKAVVIGRSALARILRQTSFTQPPPRRGRKPTNATKSA